jgi:hypothetical protein
MEPTGPANQVGSILQGHVKGVGKHDLCAGCFDLMGSDSLDGTLGPHGHKCRALNGSMGGVKPASASAARILVDKFKSDVLAGLRHSGRLSIEGRERPYIRDPASLLGLCAHLC